MFGEDKEAVMMICEYPGCHRTQAHKRRLCDRHVEEAIDVLIAQVTRAVADGLDRWGPNAQNTQPARGSRGMCARCDHNEAMHTGAGSVDHEFVERPPVHSQHSAPEPAFGREALGRLVREVWIDWAKTQPDARTGWLEPWEDLEERHREVDRLIGEALRDRVIEHLRRCEECQDDLAGSSKVVRSEHSAPGLVAGSPLHVALWDAINEYVRACGGNASARMVGPRRMDAVAKIERMLRAITNAQEKQPEKENK